MFTSWLYLENCQNLARTKSDYPHCQILCLPLPEKSCVDRSSDGLSVHAQSAKAEGAMYGSSVCATWRLQIILTKQRDHVYLMADYASEPPDHWWV